MNKKMELLIFNAYHGELTEAERETLSEWVMESPENARELLEYSVDSHSITIALRSGRVAEAGSSLDSTNVFDVHNADDIADQMWMSTKSQEPVVLANNVEEPGRKSSFSKRVLATLVALTIVCGVYFAPSWIQLGQNEHENLDSPSTDVVQPSLPPKRPQEMDDLNKIYFADQSDESRSLVVPECGYVCYRFEDGFILIEGTNTYQLGSDYSLRLIEGPLAAKGIRESVDPTSILIDGTEILLQEVERNQELDTNIAAKNALESSESGSIDPLVAQTPIGSSKFGQAGILRTHADVSTILGSLETRWLNETVVIKGLDLKSMY